MRRLIEFIAKYREYIIFFALVLISVSFISLSSSEKIGGYKAFLVGFTGNLQETFGLFQNSSAIRSENKAVKEMNLYLSSELTRSRRSVLENEKLRSLLEFKKNSKDTLIGAEIVGRSTIELRSYATLNKGLNAGIEQGMIVRTDVGLIGTIVTSNDMYSLVELISNRNVKISSKIRRTGINGILVWNGGDEFILKNIPESYDVRAGDVLVTSNFSNKFPIDVPIGTVSKIEKETNSLFMKIKVKSFVDLNIVEQVFVVKSKPDTLRLKLIKEMEAKLLAKETK